MYFRHTRGNKAVFVCECVCACVREYVRVHMLFVASLIINLQTQGNKAEADQYLAKAGQAVTPHTRSLPADSVAPRPLNVPVMSEAASRSPAPGKRKDQPEEAA